MRLTDNGFGAIGNFPALKSIIVDSCGMNNHRLNLICNAKTLTSFTMPRNQIDDDGLRALKKLNDLEYLELGETQISGMGLTIAQKGGGLKHLKFLGMYGNPLNDDGAKAISGIKSWKGLSLGSISVMQDVHFAAMVQGMKNLQYVYLSKCTNINGSGLMAMKNSKTLEELHIDQCPNIGDPVIGVLKTFKNLKLVTLGRDGDHAKRELPN